MLPACDADRHLDKVPSVSWCWKASCGSGWRSSGRTSMPTVAWSRDSLHSYGGQHLLDHPQAQWEPEVKPNRVGDDLRWKSVAFVADGLVHAAGLKPEVTGQNFHDIIGPESQKRRETCCRDTCDQADDAGSPTLTVRRAFCGPADHNKRLRVKSPPRFWFGCLPEMDHRDRLLQGRGRLQAAGQPCSETNHFPNTPHGPSGIDFNCAFGALPSCWVDVIIIL
jgi:hypothetical protein